tara:strand:+ start:5942 stop:6388 length:447 start_codon:yes stop_codon:yes gene_type:complete
MKNNYFETTLGLIILIFASYAMFIFIQANKTYNKKETIELSAKFLKSGGIFIGNDVKLRGIKIGTVSNVSLDEEYLAKIDMLIDKKINLPRNSEISVQSDGILGNKYISILPGDESQSYLVNQDSFLIVNDFESIEDQVSKIIFLATQ